MKKILFAFLVTLKLIPCSAQSDSLKTYPVPKWKLDILLDAYHYDLPACNSTLIKYAVAADSLQHALNAGSKVIELRTEQRDLKALEATQWQSLYINSEQKRNQEAKKGRKRLFKTTAISIVEAVIIAILIL